MVKKKSLLEPREYMELAIEEMRKSKNEPRPDGKVPPKVGAVLVFPEGRVVKAYRGELRDGDHAEFGLMERKLANENLEECVLYTTLEPCVKRNPPKVPCCRRTTNARIKKVYVGIEDPDPTVDGKGIKHLEKHDADVEMFDPDLQKIIEEENEGFIKQAVERKKKSKKGDSDKGPLEEKVVGYNLSRLSDQALQHFNEEASLGFEIGSYKFNQYLADAGVLAFDKEKEVFEPTGFGLLLFGENPSDKFHQAVLKCHADFGAGEIEPKDFGQALVLIPDLVEQWLKKVLPTSMNREGFKREDVPDFPIPILREAVVNALVHRDYSIEGASSTLEIDQKKILVRSPGAPLKQISLEKLNTFQAPSLRRNPIISFVFSKMDYMEEKGFGMKTFKSLQQRYGLPLPEFKFQDPYLELSFARNVEGVKEILKEKSGKGDELKQDELDVYEYIKVNGPVRRADIDEVFDFETRATQRILKELVGSELIEVQGSGRSTKYVIR